jgi:hypothetical protein
VSEHLHQNDAMDELELYLDGMLTGDELARFEARLAHEPGLRSQVELQKRVDASLSRVFAPQIAPPASALTAAELRRPWIARIGWTRLAAAVFLALLAGAAFFAHQAAKPDRAHPVEAYNDEIATGFRPSMVCENDRQMIEFTRNTLGVALVVAQAPDVQLVGWDYNTNVLTDDTVSLLVKADDDRIVVFMDRSENDRRIGKFEGSCRTYVHRRQIGEAVLYEVSPRREAVVLPLVKPAA